MQQDLYCDITDSVSLPVTATTTTTCYLAVEMTGNGVLVGDFVEQEESSIMGSQKKESSSEWTNEKHSLYLKSIEASFVDQLYNSLDFQRCQTQKTSSSNAISSGQFRVLQGGCWSKRKFKKENSHSKRSHGNPWIQHFINGSRQERQLTNSISQQNPVPESHFYKESGSSNTEATDQNFIEDTSIEKSKRPHNTKKSTETTDNHSTNDQVVPFCTSSTKAKK